MAVTKITSKQAKSQSTDTLLANRNAAQAALAANPNDKVASANLSVLNKEIGKDIGVSAGVANQLTKTQVLSVFDARSKFESTANLGTAPANVQNAVSNSLNKNIKAEEKQLFSTLDKVQDAEIKGLLAEGASKDVIAATKTANNAEDARIKAAIAATGFQGNAFTRNDKGYVTSDSTGFANDAAGQRVIAAMNAGYGLLDELNLTQQYKTGETTIGNNIYKLGIAAEQRTPEGNFVVTPELKAGFESPRSAPQLARYLNSIADEKAAPSLSRNAKVVSSGVANGVRYEVVTDKIASGIKGSADGVFIRYLDPASVSGQSVPAGTVQYVSGSTNITPTGDQGWLGTIVSLIGSIVTPFNPLLGSAFVAAGTGINDGDFGDILKAVALNYISYRVGGYLGEQLGLGEIGSVSDDLAASVNLITNPIDELNAVANGIKEAAKVVGSTVYDLVTDPRVVIDDFINRVANSPAAGILNNVDSLANPAALEDAARVALAPSGLIGGDDAVVVTPTAPTIPTGGIVGGAAANVAPPVDITATQTTPDANVTGIVGNIANIDTAPTVDVSDTQQSNDTNLTGIVGGVAAQTPAEQAPPVEVEDRSRPVVPTPNPSLLDTAGNIIDIAQEYVPPALVIASLLDQTPVPTGVGDNKLPAWVFDPSMSGVIPRIQAAQAAMPAPMPNLFNAQFQRGGLGAGQFIGYDLLNRTGDIPNETLLGVSPLAMAPMNLLGINYGQAPTSAPALV